MDDNVPTLGAAAVLAFLAFAGSRGGQKGAAPAKKKEVLTPAERTEQ